MRQNDLRSVRIRRKQRSNTRLFALLGCVLILAFAYGAYTSLSPSNEKPTAPAPAISSAPAPADTSAQVPPAAAAPVEAASAAEEKPPAEPPSQPAQKAPAGTSILIKKSEFRLYLLADGDVVNSWPIALGKNAGQKRVSGDMKTPNGSFPIDEVLDSSYWTHDFHDGKGEIEGAYGPYFISLDTSALSGGAWDGIGIHGTHDPASIGTRASEGCIRMNNEDLCALKEHVNVGMQVTIEE
ncbi:L,D-transpeptidase [Selenomonas sp. oral taxon 920]|uniref:L,D-transpeptidase n=1 Tax=Selenomonas sp. oral taxon 920 TaxID=1884263 RepID=UPI000AAD44BB|nr:L,D-transpeptidase [Selenomonas sp. oral taxon 920]